VCCPCAFHSLFLGLCVVPPLVWALAPAVCVALVPWRTVRCRCGLCARRTDIEAFPWLRRFCQPTSDVHLSGPCLSRAILCVHHCLHCCTLFVIRYLPPLVYTVCWLVAHADLCESRMNIFALCEASRACDTSAMRLFSFSVSLTTRVSDATVFQNSPLPPLPPCIVVLLESYDPPTGCLLAVLQSCVPHCVTVTPRGLYNQCSPVRR